MASLVVCVRDDSAQRDVNPLSKKPRTSFAKSRFSQKNQRTNLSELHKMSYFSDGDLRTKGAKYSKKNFKNVAYDRDGSGSLNKLGS